MECGLMAVLIILTLGSNIINLMELRDVRRQEERLRKEREKIREAHKNAFHSSRLPPPPPPSHG